MLTDQRGIYAFSCSPFSVHVYHNYFAYFQHTYHDTLISVNSLCDCDSREYISPVGRSLFMKPKRITP